MSNATPAVSSTRSKKAVPSGTAFFYNLPMTKLRDEETLEQQASALAEEAASRLFCRATESQEWWSYHRDAKVAFIVALVGGGPTSEAPQTAEEIRKSHPLFISKPLP